MRPWTRSRNPCWRSTQCYCVNSMAFERRVRTMARAVKCARQLMSVPGVGVRMMAYALQHGLTFEKTWPSGRRRRFAKPLYVASRQVEAQEFDVMVELLEQDGLIISFRDSGIGMTPDVVRDYFLRAGASFRDSRRWKQEFTASDGSSQIRRSGRFGVREIRGLPARRGNGYHVLSVNGTNSAQHTSRTKCSHAHSPNCGHEAVAR